MKIFFSVFLAIIAAFAIMHMWDAYDISAILIALAVLVVIFVACRILDPFLATAYLNGLDPRIQEAIKREQALRVTK